MSERLLSVAEVAKLWGVDPRTVRRLLREELIRSVRIGRLVRVPESALAEYIRSSEQNRAKRKPRVVAPRREAPTVKPAPESAKAFAVTLRTSAAL